MRLYNFGILAPRLGGVQQEPGANVESYERQGYEANVRLNERPNHRP